MLRTIILPGTIQRARVSTKRNMTLAPDALVIPVFQKEFPVVPSQFQSSLNVQALWTSTRAKSDKALEARLFHQETGPSLSLVALGKEGPNENARREAARKAVATGVKAARGAGARTIRIISDKISAHDAAVAAKLATFKFTLQTKEQDPTPSIECASESSPSESELNWQTGSLFAEGQNLARELMELPGNMMTPTMFCERAVKALEGLPNVDIHVRDEAWAAEKGMVRPPCTPSPASSELNEHKKRTFLSVTAGTAEPAKFLEIHYNGAPDPNARPLALVGKGITFDTGGISIKPSDGMKLMRGDMGGAATVLGALVTIVKLKLPINVVLAIPLAENMPGGKATKPGDIIVAMNGKTCAYHHYLGVREPHELMIARVEVDNTDAEGRLVLSDALWYISSVYKPHTLIDVATLTAAIEVALGNVFTGVFSTSDELWNSLYKAGEAEYDRFWRMPLDEDFGPQIYRSNADLCNTGGKPGGSCTAALFLKAFVEGLESVEGAEPLVKWCHLDIGGTMEATREGPYQNAGMTGRGVRGLVEFARQMAKSS